MQYKCVFARFVCARTKLQEPAFPVGVEEGVREIIAVVLGDLEGLVFNAVVQVLSTEEEMKCIESLEQERVVTQAAVGMKHSP